MLRRYKPLLLQNVTGCSVFNMIMILAQMNTNPKINLVANMYVVSNVLLDPVNTDS